jgi:nickel/cobalt exporter
VIDLLPLGTALVLGLGHALEVDHLVAVTTFVSRRPSIAQAAGFGARWGLGHSAAVVALGSALLLLGVRVPERVEAAGEVLVGLVLIGLGAWAFRSAGKLSVGQPDGQPRTDGRDRQGIGLVGILHGLAGTGAVIALVPVTLTDQPALGFGYLLAFSLGVIGAMTAFAMVAAGAMQRAIGRSLQWGQRAARFVGVAGIVVGIGWVIRAVG